MEETLLTVDTATRAGSVAISRGTTVLGEILLQTGANHTDRLLVTIRQLLQNVGLTIEDLHAFGVVIGPGAFTGLRVGVATVKGLALATDKPVVGISSLQTLAMQVPACRYPVCTLLDARKQEVYAGLYAWQAGVPAPLRPEAVLPPEQLLESLDDEVLFVGDGAVAYRSLIVRRLGSRAHFAPWPQHLPRASFGAALVLDALRAGDILPLPRLLPRYIRPSEAELLWARKAADGAIEG